MTNRPKGNVLEMRDFQPLQTQLADRIAILNPVEVQLLLAFVDQILRLYDPDLVGDFLALQSDARLSSILQLAAALDDEARDQLLFEAEALYAGDV